MPMAATPAADPGMSSLAMRATTGAASLGGSPGMQPLHSSPRAASRRQAAPPGDDDPASELNSLRRELRHAQAALREAGLQASQVQEEVLSLRRELIEVEAARDDALARESALRARLVAERARVDATMAAAENLISTLRSMEPAALDSDDALAAVPDDDLDSSPLEGAAPEPRLASLADVDPGQGSEGDTVPPLQVPTVSFEDLRVVSPPAPSSPAPRGARGAAMPRTRSTPSIRPRSTRLLADAFGVGAACGGGGVRRAVSDERADSASLPALPTSPGVAPRVPMRAASVTRDAHAGDIFCAAASLDGGLLATGGDDRTVRIISLRAPAPPVVIADLPKSATAVAFLPDDAASGAPLLAAGTADGALRLFRRAAKRRARWTLEAVAPAHTAAVRRARFHADDPAQPLVLTAAADRTLKITDVRAGARVFVAGAPSAALDVAPLPASPALLSAHRDGALRLWEPRAGAEPVAEAARVHARAAVAVAPLDDGRGVLSLGRDNAIRVADSRMNMRVVRELDGGVDTVSDWHRVAADGRLAFCGLGPGGDLGVWNVDSGKLVKRLSSVVQASPQDVIDLVAKSFATPAAIVVPLWTNAGRFVCAHKTRQVSFWDV